MGFTTTMWPSNKLRFLFSPRLVCFWGPESVTNQAIPKFKFEQDYSKRKRAWRKRNEEGWAHTGAEVDGGPVTLPRATPFSGVPRLGAMSPSHSRKSLRRDSNSPPCPPLKPIPMKKTHPESPELADALRPGGPGFAAAYFGGWRTNHLFSAPWQEKGRQPSARADAQSDSPSAGSPCTASPPAAGWWRRLASGGCIPSAPSRHGQTWQKEIISVKLRMFDRTPHESLPRGGSW